MPIRVSCPSCDATLNAPDAAAGKTVKCPKCQTPMVLPDAPTKAPPAPVVARAIAAPAPVADAPAKPRRRREEDEDDEDDDQPRERGRKRRDAPAKPQPEDRDSAEVRKEAVTKVRSPAFLMMFLAGFGVLVGISLIGAALTRLLDQSPRQQIEPAEVLVLLGLGTFWVGWFAAIGHGAYQMRGLRSYRAAKRAAVMALLPLSLPGYIFWIIAGFLALRALNTKVVRKAFEQEDDASASGRPPHPDGSDEDDPDDRPRGRERKRRGPLLAVLAGGGALAVLVLGVGAYLAYQSMFGGRPKPPVFEMPDKVAPVVTTANLTPVPEGTRLEPPDGGFAVVFPGGAGVPVTLQDTPAKGVFAHTRKWAQTHEGLEFSVSLEYFEAKDVLRSDPEIVNSIRSVAPPGGKESSDEQVVTFRGCSAFRRLWTYSNTAAATISVGLGDGRLLTFGVNGQAGMGFDDPPVRRFFDSVEIKAKQTSKSPAALPVAWKPFTPPGTGLTVEVPGSPKLKPVPKAAGLPPGVRMSLWEVTQGGKQYLIQVMTGPDELPGDDATLDRMADDFAKGSKFGAPTSRAATPVGGQPGRQLVFGPPANSVVRMATAGRRIYFLQVSSQAGPLAPDDPAVTRFFDSAKLK